MASLWFDQISSGFRTGWGRRSGFGLDLNSEALLGSGRIGLRIVGPNGSEMAYDPAPTTVLRIAE